MEQKKEWAIIRYHASFSFFTTVTQKQQESPAIDRSGTLIVFFTLPTKRILSVEGITSRQKKLG